MRTAIHFGAGNIGRGFIGVMLEQSGWHVMFADVNTQIIDCLNEGKGYRVNITDLEPGHIDVRNVSGIRTDDEALVDRMAGAELITTAVGLTIIPRIAPVIAAGLAQRCRRGITAPLNIIACENGVAVSTILREEVLKCLTPDQQEFAGLHVGFPDCSVDRIVPPVTCENPLDVSVERYCEWNVDRAAFKGPFPGVEGMNFVDNLPAYNERKLFTLNTGHAVTSYLGCLRGYDTVDQAIADPFILDTARGAMLESGEALILKYGFDRDEHRAYIEKTLMRFRNPYLHDELRRVGREPLRKLSAGDRLVKPLMAARGYGVPVPNLIKGISAALCYDNPADPQSVRMRQMLSGGDLRAAVSEITGLDAGCHETEAILAEYGRIGAGDPSTGYRVEGNEGEIRNPGAV